MFRVALVVVGVVAPGVVGQQPAAQDKPKYIYPQPTAQDKLKHVFTPHKQPVFAVRMSPDGRVVVSQDSTGQVRASDLSGRKLFLPGGVVRPMHHQIGFVGDSSVAALLGKDGMLRAWSPLGGVVHHETRVTSPALAREWVVRTEADRASTPATQLNVLPCFGPGNRLLAAFGSDLQIHVWDAATGRRVATLEGKFRHAAQPIVNQVLINGRNGQIIPENRVEFRYVAPVVTVAFSSDGSAVAVQFMDQTDLKTHLRLHTLPSGKKVEEWIAPDTRITLAAFSPDGRSFAWSWGEDVHVWDVVNQKEACKIGLGQGVQLFGLAFEGQGGALIGVAEDVQHWDTATGARLRRMEFPVGNKTMMAMPGHRWLVRGNRPEDNAPRLMEAATGRLIEPDAGEIAGFPLHVFSPDGRTAFSIGNPGTLREMLTGTTMIQIPPPHGTGLSCAAFGAGGSLLVTGGSDGRVAVWDWRRIGGEKGGKDLGPLWDDIGSKDGAVAHKALATMLGDPAKVVALLGEKTKPVSKDEWQKLEKLVAQLDSRKFAEREEARKALAERGSEISFMLQRVLSERPSLEMRRRIEELMDDLKTNVGEGDYLRRLRAVQALEWIGTAEAKKVLESLAGGHADARLTREAKAALGRMK